MEPIDLRVASVREARNADRRFCFEIITPNFTRVYQATSEEDMKSWIYTINNALQSAVEGKGAQGPVSMDSPSSSIRKDFASALTGKSHSQRSGSIGGNKIVGRHATVGDRPSNRVPAETNESSQKLLKQIRDADESNKYCADCESESKVDWVSINLGVVICIECSGIHRSLGTHVTKVRSLTLDPNAFTQDVIEIFLTVGNRISNAIWEAKLDRTQKSNPQSTREQRLRFITSKYADRAYVQPLSASQSHFVTADETLLASIKKNDIENVVYALALRANPNVLDKSRSTHAVFLALAAADPASPSASSTPTPGGSPSHPSAPPPSRKSFPVAELLLLNGANIPTSPPPIPLSLSGRIYLDTKTSQLDGRRMSTASGIPSTAAVVSPGPRGSPTPDLGAFTFSPSSSSSRAIDEYLPGVGTGGDTLTALPYIGQGGPDQPRRKRISSGGRLVKQLPGDRAGASSGGGSPRDTSTPFFGQGFNNNGF
jgi:Arf-GAP/SH3 domain/ANK repeat/PH domain-containing protein